MAWSCKLGLHRWVGCQCQVCGVQRDSDHNWIGCRCSVCGRQRYSKHKWTNRRCEICGAPRPVQADIPSSDPSQSVLIEHQCLAENPCSIPLGHFQNFSPLSGLIRDGDVVNLAPCVRFPGSIGYKIGVTIRVRR